MRKLILSIFVFALLLVFAVPTASASHAWGSYHWARTSNPFNLKLGDNVTTLWDSYLGIASTDWTASSVLNTTIVTGQAKGNCRPTSGRVEVCNKAYGSNGWLGLAQIWVSGSHITQGVTKMNDTYFNTSTYNKPAWRQFVVCQEVGHTFGLDHQDETFNNANMGSCMDYTNDPDGTIYNQADNTHPNQHDYDELALIYAHLDSITTVGQTVGQTARQTAMENLDNPSQWGRLVKSEGRIAVYERDFGGGYKVFTFVIWAE